jgi:hypothetical protein
VSLEHTLFLDFLKLFLNMRLIVSFARRKKTHFLDLRIKSYGCLKFQGEVWAGRACAAANEKELTTCAKSRGQEEKKFKKNGTAVQVLASTRRLRVDTRTCPAVPILLKFLYFLKMNFWKFGKWARAFGRMGVQHPHFLKLAPTLGSANSSKIHGKWRFHFFL